MQGSHSLPLRHRSASPLSCSCQCWEYVSAEELCNTQCLAGTPLFFLAWSPGQALTLHVESQAGDSIQKVSLPG